MKKNLLTSLMSVVMIFMVSVMTSFADDTAKASMTSADFLATSNEAGIITLSENTTLTDSLKVDSGKYIVDLNGHTLKFTKANNLFVNNANVTFKNGTINLDGIKGSADCILGVGDYISSATVTLDNVNVQANNYTSPYALIYVYNDSTLNIENNSSINAKNEKSLSGGVIKTSKGQAGKVNITNSTLNFENTARGFVDGTINMKSSEVSMKGLANGINSSNAGLNLTVDNSDLTITNSIGSALKIDNSEVNVVNDSKLDLNKSLAGDIQFASKGTVTVDKSSELNVDKIKLDNSIKDTDLDNLIVSERNDFNIDDKGNVIKECKHANEKTINQKEATCTEDGYTGDIVCADCNELRKNGTVEPKKGHTFEDGKCSVCGEADPNFKPVVDTDKPSTDKPEDVVKPEETVKPGETVTPDNTVKPEVQKPVEKPNTENNSSNQTELPQTGDNTNIYVMFGMVVVSIVGLVYVKKSAAR